jgi:5-(carboxyamino)imidazole ribonucleotide mutase
MTALVGIIMGSRSDWETMRHAARTLDTLAVPYETRVMSAHRTPDLVDEYVTAAESRGLEVIIAGAGGAAHLAGVAAAKTLLPVLGVPIQSRALNGIDSLLSTVQMPGGIPVGTLAIGHSGAINAALLAAAILANKYPDIRRAIRNYRETQSRAIRAESDPREQAGSRQGSTSASCRSSGEAAEST